MTPADGPRSPSPRRPAAPEGEPSVFLADEQSDVEVDVARLARLAEHVLAAQGVTGECELSLWFVDEAEMAELNGRFLESPGPTDVIALPIDDALIDPGRYPDTGLAGPDRVLPEPSEVPLLLGDVFVCPSVARRNAPDHAGTLEDELALLVVHGILHVLGMDHAVPDEEVAMQERERELLRSFDGPGPTTG